MTDARAAGSEAAPPTALDAARTALAARCTTIEEAYEFMLAYAAQGLPHDQGSAAGGQIRDFLRRCDDALTGLGAVIAGYVAQRGIEAPAPYAAFIRVLERDASDAQAAIHLVLAQPTIGSQIIDNLNASMHLRALLTDLFLIDEVLKG